MILLAAEEIPTTKILFVPDPTVCDQVSDVAFAMEEVVAASNTGAVLDVGAVLNRIAPEPPLPVPFEASNVKFAPAIFVPAAAAPLIVVAVGVPPSPAPKIDVEPAT